jgi:hypothetical protein
MKTVFPLILFAMTVGCAHQLADRPAEYEFASQPTRQIISTPIELAQKNYTNGMVSEAFTGLLNSYDNTHELQCLEFAAELADREIQWMREQIKEKSELLADTQNDLEHFDRWNNSSKLFVGDKAYAFLRGDGIETFSKEHFIPRSDQIKNNMIKVQIIVSSEIANPNNTEYNRLLTLAKKIKTQRESVCELRLRYISKIFIGPRVALGDKLVWLAQNDHPSWGWIPNPDWIEKLELLFPKDYGVWIAQSDERTRLDFKSLVSNIKNAIGAKQYEDFQATLDLLSNNKESGIDNWWPAESAKQ